VRHVHKHDCKLLPKDTFLPLCRLDIKQHCTTVQVQLVKMQRIMKHDKYVVVSSVDIGECMDLSFLFKMPRKAKT
jgi:hypothetical protein